MDGTVQEETQQKLLLKGERKDQNCDSASTVFMEQQEMGNHNNYLISGQYPL